MYPKSAGSLGGATGFGFYFYTYLGFITALEYKTQSVNGKGPQAKVQERPCAKFRESSYRNHKTRSVLPAETRDSARAVPGKHGRDKVLIM